MSMIPPPTPPASPPSVAPPAGTSSMPPNQAPLGTATSGFFDTVRSESIKVRTVRSFWFMVGLAIAFPVVVTILTAMFADNPFGDKSQVDNISSLCVLPAMILGAFGVTSLTSEYGHQTIRVTYAATPNRLRVHLAKLLTVVSLAAAAEFVAYFASWAVVKASNSDFLSITSSLVFKSWMATVVMGALITVFGYAIGLNLRNSAASVTLFLLWPLLIESLIGGLASLLLGEGVFRWFPYSSLLSSTTSIANDFDFDSAPTFGLVGSELYFLVVSGALWAIGMYRESHRDA